MTAGSGDVSGTTVTGFKDFADAAATDFGTLEPHEFVYDGTTYEVVGLLLPADESLQFELADSQRARDLDDLTLYVDGVAAKFKDATFSGAVVDWTDLEVTLTDGESYIVGISYSLPAAPYRPTLTSGNAQLKVSWREPFPIGGSPITDYDVESCLVSTGCSAAADWTDAGHIGTGTDITITGLTNDVEYQVRVRAENVAGDGPWSEASSATPSDNQPPVIGSNRNNIPVSVLENTTGVIYTFSATDPNGDNISWSIGGDDAAAFTIASASTNGATAELSTAMNTTLDYDSGKILYEFSLRASDGKGGEAVAVVRVSVWDASPTAPTAPTVAAASHSSLDVSWSGPDRGTGTLQRPAATDYDLRYCPTGSSCDDETGTDWSAHDHTGTGTTATITGLDANTEYAVQVRASNAEGAGPWSPSGTGTTNAAPTQGNRAPTITNPPSSSPTVVENTASGTSLHRFTATDADGDTITWSLEGKDAGLFAISAGGELSTASALDHEESATRTITVQANDGTDTRSVTVTVKVADTSEPPGQPIMPTVEVASTTSLKVTWSAPPNAGPDITDYDVRYRVGTSGNWTNHTYNDTATSTTITGLTEDTGYEVQVRASNAEGTGDWSNSGTGSTTPEVYFYPTSGDLVSGGVVRSSAEGCRNEDWIWSCLAEEEPDGDASMITLIREGVIELGFTVASGDVPGTVAAVWFEVIMAASKDAMEIDTYGFTVFAGDDVVATVNGSQAVGEDYVDVTVGSADITDRLWGKLDQAKINIEAPAKPHMQLTRVRMVVQYDLDE